MDLCRLCRREAEKRSQPKGNFRDLIKKAFQVDVDVDCACCPLKVCDRCRRDLQKMRKHYHHRKTQFQFSFEVVDVQHQSGCKLNVPDVCAEPPKQVSLQDAADNSARSNNFLLWKQDNTLIYAKITKDADSPIQVQIEADGSWKVLARGTPVEAVSHPILLDLPAVLTSETVHLIFEAVTNLRVCVGNQEFQELSRSRFPDSPAVFYNKDGKKISWEEMPQSTIRHIKCQLLSQKERCTVCQEYKLVLNALNHKLKNKEKTVTPTTRNDCMTKTDLQNKLKQAKAEKVQLKRQIAKLEKHIAKETNMNGIAIDEDETKEFSDIMMEHDKDIEQSFESDNPNLLLWKQHMKNSKNKNSKQNRWHPLVLKWCIALHYKSAAAYDFMRNSGMLSLPHRTTLRKYYHFTEPKPGYNPDTIDMVVKQAGIDKLQPAEDFKRNVSIIFDEIKVKAGLVYKASTGKLVGFTDLGSINNDLLDFARRVEGEGKTTAPELATHVLSVMVRGIFSPLHTSIAYFPTSTATGDQLYKMIWDGVEVLELVGFHVRAFIADGASTNRKFFKLHSQDGHRLTYSTPNRYSADMRDIYFICDVPHLVKTIRNNWENSKWNSKTRKLTYKKQEISWPQLLRLYDSGHFSENSPGFTPLYRITADHLYLNPSLRMKVKLAAQVLSSTVAKAFEFEGRSDTQSTIQFVTNMDKFFDCLNVRTPYQRRNTRKVPLAPYESPNDERLQWLLKDFMEWLEDWENEALNTPGLSRNQQRQLCLSEQTLDGLRITVFSFVSLAKELLVLPGVKFLCSDKLNQDPQEEYFSKIRAAGGTRTNPTVQQYADASVKILVGGACIRGSLKGNCKRQAPTALDSILPKARKL